MLSQEHAIIVGFVSLATVTFLVLSEGLGIRWEITVGIAILVGIILPQFVLEYLEYVDANGP